MFASFRFVTGGVPQGHYSHVFVDEAGHAVETECIIPLAGKIGGKMPYFIYKLEVMMMVLASSLF